MTSQSTDIDNLVETADGSLTLRSTRYGQTYHSIHGARTESRHVFLDGSQIIDRLMQRTTSNENMALRAEPFKVLELGLGFGLNALLTAEAAKNIGAPLVYLGIENDFADFETIERVLSQFSQASVETFSAVAKQAQTNETQQARTELNDFCELQVWYQDIPCAIERLINEPKPKRQYFNAIYLDAFSPDSNPECWTDEVLCNLANLLVPGGTLSTYCAKGAVRRALISAGLNVTRRPGPPGKRECLVGERPL